MVKNPDFDGAIVHWLNDYAPQGILTTDTDFVIRGWNRWLEQATGRTAESVVGARLFDVFPELVQRRMDHIYHEARNGHVTLLAHRFHKYLLKMPARPEYGLSEMQQSARVAPLVSDEQIIGTITAIDDVSERVVRENELTAAREEADKANRAKDKFLAVLSHDLRTPLTAILGWARLFRDRPSDDLIRKGTEVIERNATIQLELIEQVLDMSRFTAAKLELNVAPVSVREIVLTSLETLEPIAAAKGIKIGHLIPAEPRVAVLDAKRFQQIIWNLMSNALKFTPRGGWTQTTLKYSDHGFQLMIADSGKGISGENLGRIFDPLWQAEGSGGHGGLGLGLAIVKSLVELHGGSVRAESGGAGHGAAFIVEMPWGPQAASTSSAQSNSHVT